MKNTLLNYRKISIVISLLCATAIMIYSLNIAKNDPYNTPYELVVKSDNNTWNYQIFYQDKLLIKQDYIPAVRGRQRFQTQKEAQKIGELVIEKLSKRKLPTITVNDLENNDITFKI